MRLCLSFAVVFWPSVALANVESVATGADLARACREEPAGLCRAYATQVFSALPSQGALDERVAALPRPEGAAPLCVRMPDRITFEELAIMIVSAAGARPDLESAPADTLLFETLAANYPCPDQTSPR